MTICNVLCINNVCAPDGLTSKIFFNLCELCVLKSNTIHEANDNSDNEMESNV